MGDFNAPRSIARSVAKNEIETLLQRYAVLAKETASGEKMAPLFKPDSVFRLPNGVQVQPADLLEVVKGNNPKLIRHHITSVEITFVNAQEAYVESYYMPYSPFKLGSLRLLERYCDL
jgi:hypothetical protein